MAKKSSPRYAADVKKLAAKVTALEDRLAKAEASKSKWKARAKRFEAEAAKTAKRLAKAKRPSEVEDRSTDDSPSDAISAAPIPPAVSGLPDESWTVTRLRAAAREAGFPGYSRMTKAALLDSLAPTDEGASPE